MASKSPAPEIKPAIIDEEEIDKGQIVKAEIDTTKSEEEDENENENVEFDYESNRSPFPEGRS
jgi:hypothetical protein